ncbi:zf-HC2 domain-containing protein [Streptomyces sp. NPDC060194]|uniref:zf-HC2 domain-containing protein n=1 Tax=Streptomyces sp. NPDC060194 TaxID=3347069 RepID=UPI0036479E00
MRSPERERHHDVGAYALGVLDRAEVLRFEEHLARCPACTARLGELQELARELATLAPVPETPRRPPDGRLRATVRRARRRRRAGLLAAVAVLAVGVPAATLAAVPPAVASASVTAHPRAWGGTDIDVTVRHVRSASACSLVAVGRDGSRETVATWSARDGAEVTVQGGTSMPRDGIDHFEVSTPDGRRLLTVPPPSGPAGV